MIENATAPKNAARGLVCAAILSIAASTALASHVGESLTIDQQLVSATNQLTSALAQWERGSGPQRDAGVATLTQLAEQRQSLLIQLLQVDPTVASARMLPRPLRAKLPPQAQAYIEQEVHLRGNALAHIADDFANGRSKSSYKLAGVPGMTELTLFHADRTAGTRELNRMAGKKVALDAMRIGENLLILDKKRVQIEAAGSTNTTSTNGALVAAGPAVQGDQKTLSILVNFSDKAVSCTASDVANRVSGTSGSTVNTLYRDSSRGSVSFSGTAVGPYNIGYSSTGSCDYNGWAVAAEAAAKAAGVDPAQYGRVNYVTPMNLSCGWSGLAYMPGRQSWVQSCGTTKVYAHELGHNLSLHHAATPTAEYGDASDPMGSAPSSAINAPNRVMAGWQPSDTVLDVSSSGSFSISTVSDSSITGSPQVLRLAKADTSESYYVSLRKPLGFDTTLEGTFLNTVSVHRATGTLPTKTYLLQALGAGQSFSDATNGITISNQGVSGNAAMVAVSFGGAACARTAPAVSVSPSSQTGSPGAGVVYSVTVNNLNSAACGTSTFNLAQGLPSGFSGGFAASSLAIAAGASATTTWSVASGAAAPNATYSVDASAADSSVSASASIAHGSYVVYAAPTGDTTPPKVTITNPTSGATLKGNRLTISADASDDSGVQAVDFYVDSVLLGRDTSAPYTANWNLRKSSGGTHTLRVVATDSAGNTAESSITVSK